MHAHPGTTHALAAGSTMRIPPQQLRRVANCHLWQQWDGMAWTHDPWSQLRHCSAAGSTGGLPTCVLARQVAPTAPARPWTPVGPPYTACGCSAGWMQALLATFSPLSVSTCHPNARHPGLTFRHVMQRQRKRLTGCNRYHTHKPDRHPTKKPPGWHLHSQNGLQQLGPFQRPPKQPPRMTHTQYDDHPSTIRACRAQGPCTLQAATC